MGYNKSETGKIEQTSSYYHGMKMEDFLEIRGIAGASDLRGYEQTVFITVPSSLG